MSTYIASPSAPLQRLDQWYTTSSALTAALTALGFLTVARAAYHVADFIYLYLKPSKLHRYLHPSPSGQQPWALVTGATDGIGKAFAQELAAHGFNVVVHGRNPAKLAATEAELRSAHPGRDFRSLRVDAGRVGCLNCLEQTDSRLPSSSVIDFSSIAASLSDIHLTVLISNAGGAPSPVYRTLDAVGPAEMADYVSLNALFPLHLLSHLIPALARNSPALVLAVGSLSDNGLPLLSVYGPSKSFLMSLAGCVARDMRLEGRDVEVLGLRTGRVTGAGDLAEEPTLFLPDAKTFVRAALGRVGCGWPEVVPYWPHAVQQGFVVGAMPAWVRERLFLTIMSRLRDGEREQLAKGKEE